jgi:hypothetical protein
LPGQLLLPVIFLLALPLYSQQNDEAALAAFSDPARVWGNGVERVIEEAYRVCFKTKIIGGKVMNLRMPFAQEGERDALTEEEWGFLEGGKGNPAILWERIDKVLGGADFSLYTETLSDGKEKVVIFDLPSQSWTVTRDLFELARMKAGSYRGLPHRPYVLASGGGVEEQDVYNYLYCVGLAGMDCSGFVWHVLGSITREAGTDLGLSLSRVLGVRKGDDPSRYAGTNFYNSKSSQIVTVEDRISHLRPGDILLYRSEDGGMAHSAIIQSVNLKDGVVRYLQCTDEAPLRERGVHESYIYFNPSKAGASLRDPSLVWTQARYPPFPGEKSRPFSDDGERFRAYPELGGGRIVRLKQVTAAIEKINKNK